MTNFGDFRLTVFGQFNPTLTVLYMEKLQAKKNVISKSITKNITNIKKIILKNIMQMTIAEESKHEYERLWVYARYGNGK